MATVALSMPSHAGKAILCQYIGSRGAQQYIMEEGNVLRGTHITQRLGATAQRQSEAIMVWGAALLDAHELFCNPRLFSFRGCLMHEPHERPWPHVEIAHTPQENVTHQ